MPPFKKIYVYCIFFPANNKRYIGVTQNLKDRLISHLSSKHLVGRALRKYDDWQVSILHIRTDREEAKLLEIESIRNFNCINPNGYNLTRGGDGLSGYWKGRKRSVENNEKNRQSQLGKTLSEETKEKIRSFRHTAEAKEKIRQAGRRPCSDETKKKIRQSNLGKKHPETTKRNKENNPMWNSKIAKQHSEIMQGRKRSVESILKQRITCLKKAIEKLS